MKRLTRKQREWCERYEAETGFDPLTDEFLAGNETFEEAAMSSVVWFQDWSTDAFLRISSMPIPGAKP